MANLDSLIQDLKKANELRKEYENLSIKITDPVNEIIDYAIRTSIISSIQDVLEIAKSVPQEITNNIAKKMDQKYQEYQRKVDYDTRYQYAGSYRSLEELNRKFGTDFNERCIPDGVTIESNRGCNLRC